MSSASRPPEATTYRLSLYHCYLGEIRRTGQSQTVTSGRLASDLGIKDESVRRDLTYVGAVGRPGLGYDVDALFQAIQTHLGLRDEYPIVKVGSAQMLEALGVVFPPHAYGVLPVAYYSELPGDVGHELHGVAIRHVVDLPRIDRTLGVKVALVACSAEWVQMTLDLLAEAGITGVLLLTPILQVRKPEGMSVNHVRMPCDIKSLACRCAEPREAD